MDASTSQLKPKEIVYDFKRHGRIYYPVINIRVAYGLSSHIASVLVDSGATISVFRMEVAEQLHVRTTKNTQISLSGVGGDIVGYKHDVIMKIGRTLFKAPVVFSQQHTSFNILGRLGIFSKFDICFHEKQRQLSFTSVKK